jgi:hypothetical protein
MLGIIPAPSYVSNEYKMKKAQTLSQILHLDCIYPNYLVSVN